MEIVGDNTSRTAPTPTWKVVMVKGEPERFSLELQFVDEMGIAIANLPVLAENDATRTGHMDKNALRGTTDSDGIVRFEGLHYLPVTVFAEAQALADEMETRPLGLSRNPNSQPKTGSPFQNHTDDPAWRSNQQIKAEQHGFMYDYVTIGVLCDKAPEIKDWKDKNQPAFHFPKDTALKGLRISEKSLDKRHVIEVCPFRAWTLALSHTSDYSVVNGLNLGLMADLAYSKKSSVDAFFNQQCQDLSTTPEIAEFPSYFHAVSVDVPFSERYLPPVFMDTGDNDTDVDGVGAVAQKLNDTQVFSVECEAHIIVAWRGTQEVADWLTDGLFGPEKCPPELAPAGNVHGGFFEAYKLAKVKFKDNFDSIRENLANKEGKQFFICGHSLGGALGLTYAADMKDASPLLHTYGMPRTFTADAVKSLDSFTHFRHVNDSDTIPSVPPDANVDNWLYNKFGYLGETLGFFWAAMFQLPGQAIGVDMGNHFWHHGNPVIFFRTTQTAEYKDYPVMANPNIYTSRRYSLPLRTKLYLVPTLSLSDNGVAREAQETLVKDITPEKMKNLFPPNTNPSFDHGTSVFQHSMSGQYLPFLSNQVLESAWPELHMDRKVRRDEFKAQMANTNIPAEELVRNRIFLSLQDMVPATLAITRAIPGGDNALTRFKSVSEEEIERT